MKKQLIIRLTGLVCLILAAENFTFAQSGYVEKPDTIVLNFIKGGTISIMMRDIRQPQQLEQLKPIFESINEVFKSGDYREPATIEYRKIEDSRYGIEISESDLAKELETSNGKPVIITARSTIYLTLDKIDALVKLENMNLMTDLININYQEAMDEIWKEIGKLPEKLGDKNFYPIDVNYENRKIRNVSIGELWANDQLEINGGIGLGFVRTEFVPDISFNVSVNFANKYQAFTHKFGVITNLLYFFDDDESGDLDINVNTFVQGYYGYNLNNKKSSDEQWLLLGIGYLVGENGDAFEGNTFKITAGLQTNWKSIDILPELYITGDFGEVFPGIRFGLTF